MIKTPVTICIFAVRALRALGRAADRISFLALFSNNRAEQKKYLKKIYDFTGSCVLNFFHLIAFSMFCSCCSEN